MCGISGIVQSAPVLGKAHLQQMTNALAHRGPDGMASWTDGEGHVLLGHNRLAIIDPVETSAQPMTFIDRYTITYNGELYNYIELRLQLQNEGFVFRTNSDTEVILAAYAFWEEECVDHFDGMFAFAIWDDTEKELFAARDRFGEKPFFYQHANGRLIFASEMKAIHAAGTSMQPNLKMLFNFLTIGYTGNPMRPEETFFEDIFKLPAASWLYYKPSTNELETDQYWELDPDEQLKQIPEKEAFEKFNHLLSASVRRRLRSDVPTGTSLSGGLDSSMISALIHEIGYASNSHQAFTAVFPGFDKDETEWSKQVASQFSLNQHLVQVTADDLVDGWQRFTHHQEEPVSSASAFAQYKVFEKAGQENIRVLLDGQGADETLAGYHKYYKWYWQELFQKRKLGRSGELAAAREKGITESFGVKNIIASLFPDLASVVLERQYLLHALQQEDLHPEFIRLQSREAYYTTPEMHSLNGYLHFNTCVHGLEELLRYADRNSMAFGREVRLPYLNHDLVEFIFRLPSEYKIRQGWTKWILRQSADSRLPKEISWRRDKTGFEPPQKTWMADPRVKDMIRHAREILVKENVLHPSTLDRAIKDKAAYEPENFDWRYLSAATLFT
ncbi:MAG: asparagine synthase (glutamine-hydrolyzing) [Chitinophagaceae bacterium]|nr:MAG: asparagine synthase (glutamine-hydrolyzing) [Chitinophagaceae bacterium]